MYDTGTYSYVVTLHIVYMRRCACYASLATSILSYEIHEDYDTIVYAISCRRVGIRSLDEVCQVSRALTQTVAIRHNQNRNRVWHRREGRWPSQGHCECYNLAQRFAKRGTTRGQTVSSIIMDHFRTKTLYTWGPAWTIFFLMLLMSSTSR
jgi:hypothetical protein